MQNVNVQRKRNPGDTDKNGIISEYREILREAGCLSFLRIHVCISEFRNIADWQQICLVHRKRCTGMKRGGKLLKKLEESRKVTANLRENEKYLRSRLENCSDILIRPMRLGDKHKVDCLMVYIEVAVSNMMLDDSALGKMINHFWEISPEDIQEFVRHNSLGIADVKKLENLDESIDAMLAGNAVFFIDGYDKAMKISSKGYPDMGVSEAKSRKSPARFQRRIFGFCKNKLRTGQKADPEQQNEGRGKNDRCPIKRQSCSFSTWKISFRKIFWRISKPVWMNTG